MNTKENRLIKWIYKIGIDILIINVILLIIGVIFGVYIVNEMFEIKIIPSGFERSEILNYYGVVISLIITFLGIVISAIITFVVLKSTIENNNESLNKQIETQKDIMKKQFYFEAKQRHIINAENQIRDAILYFCSMDDRILYIFDDDIVNKNLDDFKCDNIDTYFRLDYLKHCKKLSNIIRELKMKIECVYLYFPILVKDSANKDNYYNLVNESYTKIDNILRKMYDDMVKLLDKCKIDEKDNVLKSNLQNKQFSEKYIEFKNSIKENYSSEINKIIKNEGIYIRDNFFNYFESLNQSYIDEIENKY